MSNNAVTRKEATEHTGGVCLPEEQTFFSSTNLGGDWLKFQDTLSHIVSVPKEDVDNAIDQARRQRAELHKESNKK